MGVKLAVNNKGSIDLTGSVKTVQTHGKDGTVPPYMF